MNKNSSFISHLSSLKRKTASFTLIELLIVVAIIAILAGILMPALSSALRKAKIINCTGNQKNIGLALSMYASDNKEFFPACTYTTTQPWHYWHRALLMAGYLGKTFQTESQAYDNDKRGKSILICPEDTDPYSVDTQKPRDFLSYGLNAEIAALDISRDISYHYIPRNRFIIGAPCGRTGCNGSGTVRKSPQNIVILTDSYHSSQFVPRWCGQIIRAFSDAEVEGRIPPRHRNGLPVTFVDGHVNFWKFPFSQKAFMFESTEKY